MLTLPDTDAELDRVFEADRNSATRAGDSEGARGGARGGAMYVQQEIRRPTPWSERPESHRYVTYRRSDKGRLVVQTIDNNECTLALDAPVVLNPVFIAKPWGQEIWFSAIEKRGESSVTQGDCTLPLSDYLALAPQRLVRRAVPVLLKILDPTPDPARGNLYFETHNTKHEVYVVTDVDRDAWPEGIGAIRLGMNQERRKQFANDEAFRGAYLRAVQAYEAVRRTIDKNAEQQGAAPTAFEYQLQEQTRRAEMESFTATLPLAVGDVVQVSPHIPHSLQHGVRVFEFQTPTYERNIISFDQRVLTQDHWDSRYAIAHMALDGPKQPQIETLTTSAAAVIERIVDFEEFEVRRVTLHPHGSIAADLGAGYMMVALLGGSVTLGTDAGSVLLGLADGNRVGLIPASATHARLTADAQGALLLSARPKPQTAATIPVC